MTCLLDFKFYRDDQVTLFLGDATEVASHMADGSVDCIVTSPPYFGLRDYGTPGQYGLEASPAEYVETMRRLFAELRRVLADDGTLWLNIGDSYQSNGGHTSQGANSQRRGRSNVAQQNGSKVRSGLPDKNLIGIPWRVAFALQDDDSADVYELKSNVPQAIYLETCRIKTPKSAADITVNMPRDGASRTLSDMQIDALHGTMPIGTSCADIAGSTTNFTASKKSSGRSAETQGVDADCGLKHCSTTGERTHNALAAESGTSHSLQSTTSAEAVTNTAKSLPRNTSPSGSISGERDTPKDSGCSAITATPQSATTAHARTKMRLTKSQIPPDLIEHFRLVRQERWILRNCVVWHKPNAMPESVTDRLSGRYEFVFMFSKRQRYWFDLDPIWEEIATIARRSSATSSGNANGLTGLAPHRGFQKAGHDNGRNPGDVWTIPTQPFPGAHFACYPPALPTRCILAGCKPGGTVLDPFNGSGTTGLAAQRTGRKYIGIDISRDYLDLTLSTRLKDAALDFGDAS